MEATADKFEGWALVEIMGHQRIAGYVTTKAFGPVILFHVTAPEVVEEETTLEEDAYVGGHWLGKGSKISKGRPRLETMVGAGSIYRMTPCSEEQALQANPLQTKIVERVERIRQSLPAADPILPGEDDDDEF